jgi:hypothetical protein
VRPPLHDAAESAGVIVLIADDAGLRRVSRSCCMEPPTPPSAVKFSLLTA